MNRMAGNPWSIHWRRQPHNKTKQHVGNWKSVPLQTPILQSEYPKLLPNNPPEQGYGGAMSIMESMKLHDAVTGLDKTSKAKWPRSHCCHKMVIGFVYFHDEFCCERKTSKQFVINARETDWYWRQAANVSNELILADINYNIFGHVESYPENLRRLDPVYCFAFVVSAAKLKAEFNDLRAALPMAYMSFSRNWGMTRPTMVTLKKMTMIMTMTRKKRRFTQANYSISAKKICACSTCIDVTWSIECSSRQSSLCPTMRDMLEMLCQLCTTSM